MKKFLLFLLASLAIATAPACGVLLPTDPAAAQTVDVYNGLMLALEQLDQASTDYLDSKVEPTLADIDRARDHAAKLNEARDALVEAKALFEAGDYKRGALKLGIALLDLEVVASELKALGVDVGSAVRAALDDAKSLLSPGT